MPELFARNQTPIKQWLELHVYTADQQLLPATLARFLCLALAGRDIARGLSRGFDEGDEEPPKSIEQLWKKNEYFYQSLLDLSGEILFYAYSFSWKARVHTPRCLLGFYELAKNIVHFSSTRVPDAIPNSLKIFTEEKLIRILFIDCNLSAIKQNLAKLSDSIHNQSFIKELTSYIRLRLYYFQQLFSLKISNKAEQILTTSLTNELEGKQQCAYDLPLDNILLCFCYTSYKVNKEKVLLSKMLQRYEAQFEANVEKEKLVKFYNEYYIYQIGAITPDHVKVDRKGNFKQYLGVPIKEQRSIMELFE